MLELNYDGKWRTWMKLPPSIEEWLKITIAFNFIQQLYHRNRMSNLSPENVIGNRAGCKNVLNDFVKMLEWKSGSIDEKWWLLWVIFYDILFMSFHINNKKKRQKSSLEICYRSKTDTHSLSWEREKKTTLAKKCQSTWKGAEQKKCALPNE